MQDSDLEEIRFDELTKAVEETYRNTDLAKLEAKAIKEGKATITEMFEVTGFNGRHVELMHEFEDTTFFPVSFPRSIFNLLEPGDVFLATLVKNQVAWKVLYLSPPYCTEQWICDECAHLEFDEIDPNHVHKVRSSVIPFPNQTKIN